MGLTLRVGYDDGRSPQDLEDEFSFVNRVL